MANALRVFSWCVYDLANTAFSALFVSFFFPLYIKDFLGGNEFHIGLAFGLSMFFVAVLVPFLGAVSDHLRRRMPFIIFFTALCCIFTWLVIYADLFTALLFGLLANFCYHASLGVYNALLPALAPKERRGTISGYGVAAGYLGTLVSLIAIWILFNNYGWGTSDGIRATFPLTALLFFIPSLLTFFFAEQSLKKKIGLKKAVHGAFQDLRTTFSDLKHYKPFLLFLLATFMFVNAITAVIIFLYLYGKSEIQLSLQSFMVVYAAFAFASLLGAFIAGKVSDKIGHKKTLLFSGYLWIPVILILLFVQNHAAFLTAGILGGIALGIFWTAQRPLLLILTPPKKAGQFFGFLEFTDKFSGILGPIIFGFFAVESYQVALASLLVFFVLGIFFLSRVKI